MTTEAIKLLLEFFTIGLKYGPQALIKVIKALESDNPTPEEIRALTVDMPETWFQE